MNPVSDTAFYTCGIRAHDAESAGSICNDKYAARFMNARGTEIFSRFSGDKMGNKGHLARHSMIDTLVRARLSTDPTTSVVTIGAGFDSRPYRLQGGTWIELDEPGIVEYKNEQLAPAECVNGLRRIPVDFSRDRLNEKLPRLAPTDKVVVVIEGVFFYLTEEQIGETLNALRLAYPGHVLICDLMTRKFMESRNKKIHNKLQQLNAPFRFLADAPSVTFTQSGYRIAAESSIIKKTLEFMCGRAMASLFAWMMPRIVDGYKVYTFETPVDVTTRSPSSMFGPDAQAHRPT